METTSTGLLDRLRQAGPDAPDWRRLHDIYLPMIQGWLGRIPDLGAERDDLAQEVLLVIVRELPSFEHRRDGAFRAWLRQITVNRTRAFWKERHQRPIPLSGNRILDELADSDSALARQLDREHDQHVFEKLLDVVQADFEKNTWLAFRKVALEQLPAAETARGLSMSVSAVIQAKSRVLKRLRDEARGMID
jgi:RNA polymerase sigma-70 factor (ECF subfamily)